MIFKCTELIMTVNKQLLRVAIYQNMTANYIKSYLIYLNNLVVEYDNSYHLPVGKKPIYADYFAFPTEIESNYEAPNLNFKVYIEKQSK